MKVILNAHRETVRFWWNRFGPMFAADIRRQRVSRMRGLRHWRWHLDKVFVKINGERNYLWRAVDHEGQVLESYKARRSVAGPSGNRSPSKVDVFGPRAPIGDELRLD